MSFRIGFTKSGHAELGHMHHKNRAVIPRGKAKTGPHAQCRGSPFAYLIPRLF